MINVKMKYPKGDDATSFEPGEQLAEGLILTLNAMTTFGAPLDDAIKKIAINMTREAGGQPEVLANGMMLLALLWGRDTGRIEFSD